MRTVCGNNAYDGEACGAFLLPCHFALLLAPSLCHSLRIYLDKILFSASSSYVYRVQSDRCVVVVVIIVGSVCVCARALGDFLIFVSN